MDLGRSSSLHADSFANPSSTFLLLLASKGLSEGGAGESGDTLAGDNLAAISLSAKEIVLAGENGPPSEEETAEPVEGVKSGDIQAFEELYEKHGPRMKSIAWNLLGNATDAEDAVQEAFLKIYRSAATFRGGSAFSTWAYRVLVNACYDLMRKRRRRQEVGDPASLERSASPAADHPLRVALEQCVARLEPRRRAAFLLFAVEGFTHREIGEILDVPEGTSKNLLFTAKRELQGMLWKTRAAASAP